MRRLDRLARRSQCDSYVTSSTGSAMAGVIQHQVLPSGAGRGAIRTVGLLLLSWAVLVAAALVQHGLGWGDEDRIWLLDLDVERSFFTWFSQLLLAGAAVLLLDTGVKVYRSDRLVGAQWVVLGGFFLFLSADEALSLHELLSATVGSALGTSGSLTFAWVLPIGALCLLGLIASIPFLLRIPARVRATMILAAVLYLGGAIGMELVGGKIYSDAAGDVTTSAYRLAAIIEEGLEGLGVLVFLFSIALYREDRGITPALQQV